MSRETWRILIVDDSLDARAEIRQLLLRGSERRYRFEEAEKAQDAIRLCLDSPAGRPDCLIVDFYLPDADVFGVLDGFRAETGTIPCPLVVVTGGSDHTVAREVIQAGAHDYIGKEWMSPQSLTRAVECAVDRFTREEELRSVMRTLEEERTRLRVVLENLPVGVMLADSSGKATLNSALSQIWRGNRPLDDREQYRSYRAWDAGTGELISPEGWPISEALRTGVAQPPRELNIERFDGTRGVILVSAVPIQDTQGAVAVAQDITERKVAEEFLRESEAKFRTVLTHMLEAVNIADRNGILLYTNPGLDKMFGYTEGELLGKEVSILNAYDSEENQRRVQAILDSLTDHGFWQGEVYNRRKDGTRFYSQATVCKVAVGDDQWFISVQEDITESKRREEERLAQHARERLLREQAESALRAKDEFVAVVSHDLRTPLSAIAGWVQILRSRATGDEVVARAVETIERNTRAQTQLIDDLLDMSRILSGNMRLAIQSLDPAAAVTSSVEAIRHAAEAKGVALDIAIEPGVPELNADPARLQQVIWNLVSNAVKFTPAGGRIEVRLERQGTFLRIQVQDTGKGISADFLPFVFDRFRQAEALVRRQGGLGLGLSIVRHLVELHGGTVEAESPGEDQGAIFTVELPIPRSSTSLAEPLLEPAPPEISPDLSGKRVLVADDDQDTRDMFAQFLRKCGMEVVTVESGVQVLKRLSEDEPFDCLVCDLGMSEMDGLATISEVRNLRRPSRLPALAVTAYAAEADRTQALAAGFNGFLTKPVNLQELAVNIATLVAGEGRSQKAVTPAE